MSVLQIASVLTNLFYWGFLYSVLPNYFPVGFYLIHWVRQI